MKTYIILKKVSFLHRIGNIIGALIQILENIVILLTFSYVLPNWSWLYIIWRTDTCLYQIPVTMKELMK